MKDSTRKVVVAMSGGVDSSVAAALLVSQGYEVIGMMLRLWNAPGTQNLNRCCTPEAMALARRVCARLNIPFYVLDVQDQFRETVVQYFLDGYAQGATPNPCLMCNKQIRWGFLLNQALATGADYLVTGHYARLRTDDQGIIHLLRAIDRVKDQSYVLHMLNQEQLRHAKFPVGEYAKDQIRQLARDFNLPVADRKDSQDLCFLGGEDYRSFLLHHGNHLQEPGSIRSVDGKLLGTHQGLAFYTIGQRKGLGIPSNIPLYVVEKDLDTNTLVVGENSWMGRKSFTAKEVSWISESAPGFPLRLQVKIRYHAQDASAMITRHEDSNVVIELETPLRDITPGQAVVFYDGECCLGGGIISE